MTRNRFFSLFGFIPIILFLFIAMPVVDSGSGNTVQAQTYSIDFEDATYTNDVASLTGYAKTGSATVLHPEIADHNGNDSYQPFVQNATYYSPVFMQGACISATSPDAWKNHALVLCTDNPNVKNLYESDEDGWILIGPTTGNTQYGVINIWAYTLQSGNSGKIDFIEYADWDFTNNTGTALTSKTAVSLNAVTSPCNANTPLTYNFQKNFKYLWISMHAGSAEAIGILKIESNSPLPVELTSFMAYSKQDHVTLKWRTETELNNNGFYVQRNVPDMDDDEWIGLGFIPGHGTSAVPQTYEFTDRHTFPHRTYYRLKQVDRDGTYEYSEIVEATYTVADDYIVSYPSPFSNTLKMHISIEKPMNISIGLYNLAGQRMKHLYDGYVDSNINMTFGTQDIPTGAYYLLVYNGNNLIFRAKALKSHY